MNLSVGRIVSLGGAALAALFALTIVFGSWYTINQRERGVILRNGAVVGVAEPGLHFKWPWIDAVEKISIENRLLRWEKLEGYSHDQQAAHYVISVNYQVAPDRVKEAYAVYGGADGLVSRILTPNILKFSKIVIGQFTAQTSIQDRGRLNIDLTKAMQDATAETPLIISGVNVEDIKFGPDYEKSINDRMVAEVAVLTLRQNAEREKVQAEITVTQAKARAEGVLAQARAEADAIRLRGEAEASAIEARGRALGNNPNLVTLVQAEKWDGKLPVTMVPGGSVPMITLSK